MVISNIGTIVLSIPSPAADVSILDSATDSATSKQVRLLSIANTASRLVAGSLADFVSPAAASLPDGSRVYPRKHFISRVAFLAGSAMLLCITFSSLTLFSRSRESLWLLR